MSNPRSLPLTQTVLACVTLCLGSLFCALNASANITLVTGPTEIPRGDAQGKRDFTLNNGLFAIAFGVDTAPPWGVARGGILDIAILRDGKPGFDIASLADFMPNNWSSWPTTYQTVSIEKNTAQEVIVKTLRDWGDVNLETRFTIKDQDSRIHIITRMTNGGKTALKDILSGYVAWPDGGYLFGMPGLHHVKKSPEDKALANWSASYDEKWALGLHAPFAKVMSYDGRDRYLPHSLQPGESREFEAWLQIEPEGNLAAFVQSEIELQSQASGKVIGHAENDQGKRIDKPAIIVNKDGQPYTWAIGQDGKYSIELPVGSYELYATAKLHGRSASSTLDVTKNGRHHVNFNRVGLPGTVEFQVEEQANSEPLDARISIKSGYKPLIEYFGKNTFFTELDPVGKLTTSLAPGAYTFEVSAGGGFTSQRQTHQLKVDAGGRHAVKSAVPVMLRPNQHGWYSADLHHHSDVLDGFTKPNFVLRSELASGIDIPFLSDHDSLINNDEMQRLSATRGLPFIPAAELSASWAHFNAYPLDAGGEVSIDIGRASVQEIFTEARRLGADVVHVNHPYSEYGYFHSLEEGTVPGGLDLGFDVVEITSEDNKATMEYTWALWNSGKRAYLAAGSDVHNVWSEESGAARSYAFIEGPVSVDKYVAALKAGHAFASQGPVVYPEIIFGRELNPVEGSELSLAYSVHAVSGLRSVTLIERGETHTLKPLKASDNSADIQFKVKPKTDTWYSLVIEDAAGKFAYSNPIWVKPLKAEPK